MTFNDAIRAASNVQNDAYKGEVYPAIGAGTAAPIYLNHEGVYVVFPDTDRHEPKRFRRNKLAHAIAYHERVCDEAIPGRNDNNL